MLVFSGILFWLRSWNHPDVAGCRKGCGKLRCPTFLLKRKKCWKMHYMWCLIFIRFFSFENWNMQWENTQKRPDDSDRHSHDVSSFYKNTKSSHSPPLFFSFMWFSSVSFKINEPSHNFFIIKKFQVSNSLKKFEIRIFFQNLIA